MKFLVGAKRLLTEDGWADNRVLEIDAGRIVRVAEGKTADYMADTLTPGLIDPHIHGGDGFDIMHPTAETMETWLRRLAQSGVSAVLATPYTGPVDVMRDSLAVISEVMRRQKEGTAGGARVLGVHLEGPFISPQRLGAMEARYRLHPSAGACRRLIEGYESLIRQMTLAPEESGADEVICLLAGLGVRILAGHSDASFEQGATAFQNGVDGVCHFFNASRPIQHRDPGFLTAALLDSGVFCEVIGDLAHLHPAAIRLICLCKDPSRVILVSDAVSTTNLPDGDYLDNGLTIEVRHGASYVRDGGLNGGGTYLPGAVRNMASLGIPFEQAVRAASLNTARWLRSPLGPMNVGSEAFLLGWDQELRTEFTVIGEQWIPRR